MNREFSFTFGAYPSSVFIREGLPSLRETGGPEGVLLVCDRHTEAIARKIGGPPAPVCVLEAGEGAKTWASAEAILRAARDRGLGRDGRFIGVGGGVVTDLTAFAASVYMRGASLSLVPTTLLGMVDAALGGKTGFDLFGIKNLAGTFFPAEKVYICREALDTLPETEWKPGLAELIKTAILDGEDFFGLLRALGDRARGAPSLKNLLLAEEGLLMDALARAVAFKGRVVEADPREAGSGPRALLNLGHTFGHALESARGLGRISHGEAVAWGTVRAAELGRALGITAPERAEAIAALFCAFGYETAAPHPLLKDAAALAAFTEALGGDKKRRGGKPRFVVPDEKGAILFSLPEGKEELPLEIVRGEYHG